MTSARNSHAWCIEWLPAFVARRLEQAQATAIGAHLDACAACSVEFDIAVRVRVHVAHQHQALAPLLEAGSEQRSFARLCRGLK